MYRCFLLHKMCSDCVIDIMFPFALQVYFSSFEIPETEAFYKDAEIFDPLNTLI